MAQGQLHLLLVPVVILSYYTFVDCTPTLLSRYIIRKWLTIYLSDIFAEIAQYSAFSSFPIFLRE